MLRNQFQKAARLATALSVAFTVSACASPKVSVTNAFSERGVRVAGGKIRPGKKNGHYGVWFKGRF